MYIHQNDRSYAIYCVYIDCVYLIIVFSKTAYNQMVSLRRLNWVEILQGRRGMKIFRKDLHLTNGILDININRTKPNCFRVHSTN